MELEGETNLALRDLGSTGYQIAPVALGTVKLGRNQGVKYPEAFELPSDEQVLELLQKAKKLGVNLIDTAPAYGKSEDRLGQLLPQVSHSWIICTKVGEEFESTSSGGMSRYRYDRDHTQMSIERSLKRLGVQKLDLVLVHSNGKDLEIFNREKVCETLLDFQSQGIIGAVGASTKTLEGGRWCLENLDLAMITLNRKEPEMLPLLDLAIKNKKGILIKKAFASGHFEPATDEQSDPVQASMDFIFEHPGVSAVVAGTINPEHLKQNVIAAQSALDRASRG